MVSMETLLRDGEVVQTWDDRRPGMATLSIISGQKLRGWPKFVTDIERILLPVLGQQETQYARRRSTVEHGGGGVDVEGEPAYPSAEMEEQAMGPWHGYTKITMVDGKLS